MVGGVLILATIFISSCNKTSQRHIGKSTNAASSPEASLPADSGSQTALSLELSSLDRILREAAPQLGGGVALLLIKDQQVVYRKAFGNYKLERVLPIASATKWLSGALILSLIDEGKLSLDDPVVKFLPSFRGDKAAITVRQLFAHTSGLPPEAGCRNNKATTLEQCAEQIAKLPLQAPPGSQFYYGGVSMHVGGRVAEIAGGKPWNDLFIERIAQPLSLNSTDYFAYGPTRNPRPAGDARSSLDDYGRFLQMLLNGGIMDGKRILSEESVAEIHKDQTAGAAIRYTIFWDKGHLDSNLPQARYGVGVWLEAHDTEGADVAASPGALGSYPWIDFKRRMAGVLFSNTSFSRMLPVYVKVRQELQRIVE